MIKIYQKISIAILVVIMLVSFVIISMPSLSAEEYGYNVNDNPFPNDENYVGYNLYDFNNVQMYKVGDGTMSYRITDDGLHIWAESNSDNLYQSYLDLQKIDVKKNTKYVIAVRIDGYQNTGAIRVASNGDGANRNNLVTVKAKPYTYQYNEFTTLDDTEYIQLYYYPNYEQSGTGNSDFRNIMIYEVNDDNGYKPYEPYGGWYKFGVDNALDNNVINIFPIFAKEGDTIVDIPIPSLEITYKIITAINNFYNTAISFEARKSNVMGIVSNFVYARNGDITSDTSYSTLNMLLNAGTYYNVMPVSFDYPSDRQLYMRLEFQQPLDIRTMEYFKVYVQTRQYDGFYDSLKYKEGVRDGERNAMTILGLFGSSLNSIGDFFMKFLGYEVLGISILEVLSGIFIVVILLWVISFLR